MSVGEIALVYGRALFEAATEAGTVERTGADLRSFVGALEHSPELASFVFNPQIEPDAKRRVIGQLTEQGDRLVVGAIVVLLEKGRIAYVGEVADAFEQLAAAASKVVDVEVTTAVPADARVEEEIRSRVLQATGLGARITSRVDPAILGGLVLRIGDVVVDGSVRGRIRQLGTRLKEVQA